MALARGGYAARQRLGLRTKGTNILVVFMDAA